MGADEAGVILALGLNGTLGLLGSAFARLPQGRRGLHPEGCFFSMNIFYLFFYGYAGSSLLPLNVLWFAASGGSSPVAVRRLLSAAVSLVAELRLQ